MLATSTNPDNWWSGADGDCKGDCSVIQIMEPLRICKGSKGYFSVLIILAKLLWWDRTELLNWSSFPVPQPQAQLGGAGPRQSFDCPTPDLGMLSQQKSGLDL